MVSALEAARPFPEDPRAVSVAQAPSATTLHDCRLGIAGGEFGVEIRLLRWPPTIGAPGWQLALQLHAPRVGLAAEAPRKPLLAEARTAGGKMSWSRDRQKIRTTYD